MHFDPLDREPWTTRTITFDPNGAQIGDIRAYAFATQWFQNHTLNIGHLGLVGEGTLVATTAEIAHGFFHGFATGDGTPTVFAYEPQFGPSPT
jgi:hypothetical protein